MVLDTSAIIAILRDEPDAAIYREAIESAETLRNGAPTLQYITKTYGRTTSSRVR